MRVVFNTHSPDPRIGDGPAVSSAMNTDVPPRGERLALLEWHDFFGFFRRLEVFDRVETCEAVLSLHELEGSVHRDATLIACCRNALVAHLTEELMRRGIADTQDFEPPSEFLDGDAIKISIKLDGQVLDRTFVVPEASPDSRIRRLSRFISAKMLTEAWFRKTASRFRHRKR